MVNWVRETQCSTTNRGITSMKSSASTAGVSFTVCVGVGEVDGEARLASAWLPFSCTGLVNAGHGHKSITSMYYCHHDLAQASNTSRALLMSYYTQRLARTTYTGVQDGWTKLVLQVRQFSRRPGVFWLRSSVSALCNKGVELLRSP